MPSLPVYQSKENVRPIAGAPQEQITQPTFKTDRTIENALTSIADEWSKANDVMQYTEAKGKYEVEVASILEQASLDPDFKNSDTYRKMLDKAKSGSLEGISNAQVSGQLSMEMDFGNQMAGIKIDSNFKQKQLAHNRFVLGQSIERLNQKKVQSTTEAEALEYDRQIQDLLAFNVSTGNIDEADAEEYKDNARDASAEYDATVNPESFLARNANWYGITQDKWVELKQTAKTSKERAKKEGEVAISEMQNNNEADLTMKLVDQSIDKSSVPEITKMIRDGEITEEFGLAYIRFLTNPKTIGRATTKVKKATNKAYYEMAQNLFKAENPEETRKALIKMFDESVSGEIKEDEIAMLLKASSSTNEKNKIVGILNSLGKMRVEASGEKLIYDFIKGIADGKDPEEAKAIAVDEKNIRENPLRTEYSYGDSVDTPMGTMYVWGYYDDGEPDVRTEKPPKK